MKLKQLLKHSLATGLAAALLLMPLTACGTSKGTGDGSGSGKDLVELTWYQIGDMQKDAPMVVEKVNEYLAEKIGVKLTINYIGWGDYNQKMQIIINTGDKWDLAFTSSWANHFVPNVSKGAFLAVDEYLPTHAKEMLEVTDPRFWDAAKVNGITYAIPNEKEIGSMPMWVFTKEYVDKYQIPVDELHSLEDLEPWLALIKEKEPQVTPLYLTRDFTLPNYMDIIEEPVGVEFDDASLTVTQQYQTKTLQDQMQTIRRYFQAGYINQNAASASDDKAVKRFVTKGDGQPFAELIWGKDLGYEVVTSPIMESRITNASARGAMTAINKHTKHPEKAVELINLINSDLYLRNLLNYGIEGEHYTAVAPTAEELEAAKGKPFIYDKKIKLNEETRKNYSVPYWVQGGLFTTYVLENEPIDKWATFQEFNDNCQPVPTFGFDFNMDAVLTQVAGFRNPIDEFGSALHTGSVEPADYLNQLNQKLETAGIQKVMDEMQQQLSNWMAK